MVRTINTLIMMMPSILLLAMVATVQCEDETLNNEVVKLHGRNHFIIVVFLTIVTLI